MIFIELGGHYVTALIIDFSEYLDKKNLTRVFFESGKWVATYGQEKWEADTYNQLMVCLGWYDAIELDELVSHEGISA